MLVYVVTFFDARHTICSTRRQRRNGWFLTHSCSRTETSPGALRIQWHLRGFVPAVQDTSFAVASYYRSILLLHAGGGRYETGNTRTRKASRPRRQRQRQHNQQLPPSSSLQSSTRGYNHQTDSGTDGNLGVRPCQDGVLLRRQPERVPAHGVEDVEPFHSPVPDDTIKHRRQQQEVADSSPK